MMEGAQLVLPLGLVPKSLTTYGREDLEEHGSAKNINTLQEQTHELKNRGK